MSSYGTKEERIDFFEKIMKIVDEAEGVRDTTYGSFSFLGENYYVRDAVVSSFDTTTSITGLKMYLAMNVLEMHAKGNASKISYNQLRELVQGISKKKYGINYSVLDQCMNIKKNKEAICEKLYSAFEIKAAEKFVEHIEKADELFPYLFMDKLRSVAWSKLRDFFKLCEQNVCSECSKKSMVYFQFIQAVALYEIFYFDLIQEPAEDYMEKEIRMFGEAVEEIKELAIELNEDNTSLENVLTVQKAMQSFNDRWNEKGMEEFEHNTYCMGVYQLLKEEFGISLNAMCYLLMIFEAMQVCTYEMRGLKHLSLKIKENLWDIYDRDLEILIKSNRKRLARHRNVNERIEGLLKHRYTEYMKEHKELFEKGNEKEFKEEDAIYTFMTELCKSKTEQNKKIFRGLEIILGYPIYHEQKRSSDNPTAGGELK